MEANETENLEESLESPELYILNTIAFYIEGYGIPCLLLLGICGNTVSLIVFTRTRKRDDAPVQYLSCLAVSDTGVIFTLGLVHWLAYGLGYITNGAVSFNFFSYSSFTCKAFMSTLHIFECISAWVILAFSMERAYIVWYPLKRNNITASKRAKIIALICLLSTAVSLHRYVLIDTYAVGTRGNACFYRQPNLRFPLWQVDTTLHNYLPSCLIFLINSVIFAGINRSKRHVEGKVSSAKTARQERRVLISLITVSTFYVIFMMPASVSFSYQIYLLMNRLYSARYREFIRYLVTFFDEFSMFNYCLNFIIYGLTLPFYRAEIKSLVKPFTSCAIKKLTK